MANTFIPGRATTTRSGRLRTPAGGTRLRGGSITAPGARRRGSTARGTGLTAPDRTIAVGGGATPRGGALARTGGRTRIRGGGSGGENSRAGGATRSRGATGGAARPGGGVSSRRVNAIRQLAARGATPGERAAATAAAQRMGLNGRAGSTQRGDRYGNIRRANAAAASAARQGYDTRSRRERGL